MKKKIIIRYNWINENDTDIKKSHLEALEETAMNRIFEQCQEGYTSGELIDCVRMGEEDGEEGIEYSGWWDMNTETE